MSDFLEDSWPMILIIAVVLGGTGLLVHSANKEEARLMTQCLADGRKEYECVSMLRSNTNVTPVPIIINR